MKDALEEVCGQIRFDARVPQFGQVALQHAALSDTVDLSVFGIPLVCQGFRRDWDVNLPSKRLVLLP